METKDDFDALQPQADDPTDEGAILAEMPGEEEYAGAVKCAHTLPVGCDGRDALPVLTAEQERHLFRKLSYLKCRASSPNSKPADLHEAKAIQDRLIRANLKLLFKILKRYDSKLGGWEDLVSDGEIALWRAVEKFDYSRGCRFSTFATKVLRHRLNARVEKATKRKGVVQFVDDYPEPGDPGRKSQKPRQQGDGLDFEASLEKLPPREREVVVLRHASGMSLTEVADELCISKTRVRQLEQQAYARLRESAELVAC